MAAAPPAPNPKTLTGTRPTAFAEPTVLDKRAADRADAGMVWFKLAGKNQRGEVVIEILREVLVRRRPPDQ